MRNTCDKHMMELCRRIIALNWCKGILSPASTGVSVAHKPGAKLPEGQSDGSAEVFPQKAPGGQRVQAVALHAE
jgi:hypothetical protein